MHGSGLIQRGPLCSGSSLFKSERFYDLGYLDNVRFFKNFSQVFLQRDRSVVLDQGLARLLRDGQYVGLLPCRRCHSKLQALLE